MKRTAMEMEKLIERVLDPKKEQAIKSKHIPEPK